MKKVGIVMGSASDLPVVKKAQEVLESLGIPNEMHIYSAHRTPVEAREFAEIAREKGFGVLIAAAGMAAHLAGAIAAGTTLPVIGIPINSSLNGLDALLATVQMPSGIPVATVAVDGAKNAAWNSRRVSDCLRLSKADALHTDPCGLDEHGLHFAAARPQRDQSRGQDQQPRLGKACFFVPHGRSSLLFGQIIAQPGGQSKRFCRESGGSTKKS